MYELAMGDFLAQARPLGDECSEALARERDVPDTRVRLAVWLVIGLMIYFAYGARQSLMVVE
jgi:hypothetical protein